MFTAKTCGAAARRTLATGCGDVLAVFNRSVYLRSYQDPLQLCCITTSDLPCGPLNLQTDQHGLAITPDHVGHHWQYKTGLLTIAESPPITLHQCAEWQPPSLQCPMLLTPTCMHIIETRLNREAINRNTTADNLQRSVTQQLEDGITQLKLWLIESQFKQLPISGTLNCLIGCGNGLTPAGDDILCGALVTLHSFDIKAASQLSYRVTQQLPANTGAISAAHLLAACEGQAIAPLHQVLEHCCSYRRSPTNALKQSIEQLLHHGDSSGYYALKGVHAVLGVLATFRTDGEL